MSGLICPQCGGQYGYADGLNCLCPECGHEWQETEAAEHAAVVTDAFGNVLADGDSITLIKALKLKGSNESIKQGTKVKNIRLVPEGDHNIDCKINGTAIMLKSEFVKKA